MTSKLVQLSEELTHAHAEMMLAREARRVDSARRDKAGFFAWLADLFGLTAAASLQRRATRRWRDSAALAKGYALAWVHGRTVHLSTLHAADAQARAQLEQHQILLQQRASRLLDLLALVERARHHAHAAYRHLSRAAHTRRRSAAVQQRHQGFVFNSSGWQASSGQTEIEQAQAALQELHAQVPYFTMELKVSLPGPLRSLIAGLAGSRWGIRMQANELARAADRCKETASGLADLSRKIRMEQLEGLQTEQRSASAAVSAHDDPHRQRALQELPTNLRALV